MLPVGTKSPEMKLRPQRDGASTAVYAATGRSKIWGMRGTGAGHGSQCLTDPELLMVFCARDPLLNFGTSHYLNTSTSVVVYDIHSQLFIIRNSYLNLEKEKSIITSRYKIA